MNLLLDTHALVWLSSSSQYLSKTALGAIQDRKNTAFFSLISLWELTIKQQIGKFSNAQFALDQAAVDRLIDVGYQLLPLTTAHVWAYQTLPLFHRDPFDRALISQAIADNLTLVSGDSVFSHYPVSLLW